MVRDVERSGVPPGRRGAVLSLAALLVSACGRVGPAPPPEDASWETLAAWAAEGYRVLGFHDGSLAVAVERVEAGTAPALDHAARAFALELLAVAPRTNVETRWILRHALGRTSTASPEAELALDAARLVRSTPLWFDRVAHAVRVVPDHPFLVSLDRDGQDCRPWHLMAHEVAHALQDRRAPLREVSAAAATYEEHVVRTALLEGEAELRMLALAAALEGKDLARAAPGWGAAELARLYHRSRPSVYEAGCAHLERELSAGGWEAVERAVLTPNVSSRDLLDPGGESAGPAPALRLPLDLALVTGLAPIEYAWEDVLGAWGLLSLLAADYPDPDDLEPLADAVRGWRADRLAVARRADGITALAWRIVLADETHAAALVRHFAGALGTVSQRGAVLDFAWSPVPSLQRAVLEGLERGG